MALLFDDANEEYLEVDQAVVTSTPCVLVEASL